MKRRQFFHSIGEAFPANNQLARVMWSLMAIHADLTFEATHLVDTSGDSSPSSARSLHETFYFFRGALRSLYSAHIQLSKLAPKSRSGEFEQLARHVGLWDEFVATRKHVREYEKHFTRYRNAFAAHSEESLEESLSFADPSAIVGQSIDSSGAIGAEFVAEVITAVSEQHLGTSASGALRDEVDRLHAVVRECHRCIQLAIRIYATRYPVFRRQ